MNIESERKIVFPESKLKPLNPSRHSKLKWILRLVIEYKLQTTIGGSEVYKVLLFVSVTSGYTSKQKTLAFVEEKGQTYAVSNYVRLIGTLF